MTRCNFKWTAPSPFDKSLLPQMESEVWAYAIYHEGRFAGMIHTNPIREKVESEVEKLLGKLEGNITAQLTIE